MQLYFNGFESWKPELVPELTEAAHFYADLLMDPRMVRNLHVDIDVHKRLDVLGECINETGLKNPRDFTINLKRQGRKSLLRTLAHEFVHLKQEAKNELGKDDTWMGKPWKPKRKEDSYYNAPWEVEAFGLEEGLYQRFISRKNG